MNHSNTSEFFKLMKDKEKKSNLSIPNPHITMRKNNEFYEDHL